MSKRHMHIDSTVRAHSVFAPCAAGLLRLAAMATVVGCLATAATADMLHVPGQFPTIQAAIDAANPGDTVLIADGVYGGAGNINLDFAGRSITVASENGPEHCIIECEGQGRGFYFHSGENEKAVVKGLTVRNGAPPAAGPLPDLGGAVACVEASPIFVGCWFINNAAAGDGGAIYVQDGDVRAEDCLFEGNRAQGGGAIRARRGTLTLVGCTLRGNTASGSGGAVQADAAVLDQCRLADNISNGRGGGVYASGLTALESAFTGNVTDYNGGAIYADHMRLTRCLISGNRARIVGGGIAATWLIADACDIRGNRSKEAGGAYVSSGPLLLLNSRFDDNTAEDGGGGGLLAHEMLWQTGHIRHCVFARNRAERKGDWGPAGGAMAFANNRRMDILNCTLVDNEALDGCAISAARQVGDPNYLTIRSCVIRGPQPLLWFYDLNLDFAYSNIEGGWPGVGNIDADPMFVDRTAGDYRLSPGSPCIDAADTPAVPHQDTADVSGAARFVDDPATPDSGVADPLRPMLDMGAFEFLSRDCNHNGLDDADDIAGGFSTDCNANGLPDECEVDCDGNGVADDCDLTAGRGEDCNGNRLPDDCDIALGLSQDINANGRPDECDVVSMPGDLNCDLFVDAKDIEPFVLALLDWQEYRRRYPDCSSSRGDINGDNRVNAFDIEGFIDLLAG